MQKFLFFYLILIVLFSACSALEDIEIGPRPEQPVDPAQKHVDKFKAENEEDGIFSNLLNMGDDDRKGIGIGVNAYLWKATLDTLSFMPLSSADPFGGVIITDWYNNSNNPNEQYKIIAYIKGTTLRVDALQINVFKKVKNSEGEWIDQTNNKELALKIEDSVFTKARKNKIASSVNNE